MSGNVTKDFRELDRLIRVKPRELDDWLNGLAERMVNDIKLSFGTNSYPAITVGHKTFYSTSRPGGPPNVDTGALRASMRSERKGALHYQIVDGVEYGVFLELGTERMGHRPFISPVFEQWRHKWPADLQKANLWGK